MSLDLFFRAETPATLRTVVRTIRGVRVWQHTLGNGKRIQIWRFAQLDALGVKFHEFAGGNRH